MMGVQRSSFATSDAIDGLLTDGLLGTAAGLVVASVAS
jgi:hypothetical protein